MTTQAEEIENKSAAKHIVGIFREILKELRSDECGARCAARPAWAIRSKECLREPDLE